MFIKKFANLLLCVFILLMTISPDTPRTAIPVNTQSTVYKLYILMYHGFTQSTKESEYVIRSEKLEDDIIYLKNNGYNFINIQDLLQFSDGKKILSEKNVMLTFDDGYLNNYSYAFPILKKHNVKAVISPIGYYVDFYTKNPDSNPNYAQLSIKEIKEMHQSGLVEFQNHSYNMHSLENRKGSLPMKNEFTQKYIREFYYDLKCAETLIKEATGQKPDAYTYPFGMISDESRKILESCGYRVSLGCEEGVNRIAGGKRNFFNLKRFNRTPQRGAVYFTTHY